MGERRDRSRERRPSRDNSTCYSSAARLQSGRVYRDEVGASSVSHFTSFTSTSAWGSLRTSTTQMEDQRRGHNEVLVRATREGSRTSNIRFWLCDNQDCGHRNTGPGDQCGRPGCRTQTAARSAGKR